MRRKRKRNADNWCMWAGGLKSGMGQLLAHGILMPFLTITVLCMAQMLLSLLFGAMAAYVAVIMYDIVSAYATSPYSASISLLYSGITSPENSFSTTRTVAAVNFIL